MKYLILTLLFSLNVSAFTISSQSSVVVSSSNSTQIVDVNGTRDYLGINNLGPGAIVIRLAGVHVATEGLYIPSGSSWYPEIAPVDSVYAKAVSGSADVHYIEGKK